MIAPGTFGDSLPRSSGLWRSGLCIECQVIYGIFADWLKFHVFLCPFLPVSPVADRTPESGTQHEHCNATLKRVLKSLEKASISF